jgi:uncharacterized protein (DUF4415 family)
MSKKPASTKRPSVDPDEAPELTEEWFAGADLHHGGTLVRRGRPPSPDKKQLVSLRLSPDVVSGFKKGGPGWQTRIDETLRVALKGGNVMVLQRKPPQGSGKRPTARASAQAAKKPRG